MGNLVLPNCENDEAPPDMRKISRPEAEISRKDWQGPQKRKNFVIQHAFAGKFQADLANRHTPTFQKQALALQNILIENIHAALAQ